MFGFEQQVLRTAPPPQELVHHARADNPVPAADGTLLSINMPDPARGAGRIRHPDPGTPRVKALGTPTVVPFAAPHATSSLTPRRRRPSGT